MRALILAAFLILPGCSSAEYYAGAAETAAKQAKDIEASALEDAPCLIGLGAWARMTDFRKRLGAFYLCVPDASRFGVDVSGP